MNEYVISYFKRLIEEDEVNIENADKLDNNDENKKINTQNTMYEASTKAYHDLLDRACYQSYPIFIMNPHDHFKLTEGDVIYCFGDIENEKVEKALTEKIDNQQRIRKLSLALNQL